MRSTVKFAYKAFRFRLVATAFTIVLLISVAASARPAALQSLESLDSSISRSAEAANLNVVFHIPLLLKIRSIKTPYDSSGESPLNRLQSLLAQHNLSYVQVDRRTIMVTSPDYPSCQNSPALEEIIKKAEAEEASQVNRPDPSRRELGANSICMRDVSISLIISTLAEQLNIEVKFDESIMQHLFMTQINFELRSVALPRALQILLDSDGLGYEQTGPRTILISQRVSQNAPSIEEIAVNALKEKPVIETPSRPGDQSPPVQSGAAVQKPSLESNSKKTTVQIRILNSILHKGQISLMGVIVSSPSDALIKKANISLRFNPSVISITNIRDGGLLSLLGAAADIKYDFDGSDTIRINMTRPDGAQAVSANGQLLLINFRGVDKGATNPFLDAQLFGPNDEPIPLTVIFSESINAGINETINRGINAGIKVNPD